jgi:hypothetical protein
MTKSINYGQLMHKALRQLMADVLSQVAREGLPGSHHFMITFDTNHPGVVMDRSLKARYPKEMTVHLQNWFEDLAVMNDRFSVALNFGNVIESIVIPFEAIKTFVDPSVEFGLRFDAHEGEGEGDDDDDDEGGEGEGGDATVEFGRDVTAPAKETPKPSGNAEVVRLV